MTPKSIIIPKTLIYKFQLFPKKRPKNKKKKFYHHFVTISSQFIWTTTHLKNVYFYVCLCISINSSWNFFSTFFFIKSKKYQINIHFLILLFNIYLFNLKFSLHFLSSLKISTKFFFLVKNNKPKIMKMCGKLLHLFAFALFLSFSAFTQLFFELKLFFFWELSHNNLINCFDLHK